MQENLQQIGKIEVDKLQRDLYVLISLQFFKSFLLKNM